MRIEEMVKPHPPTATETQPLEEYLQQANREMKVVLKKKNIEIELLLRDLAELEAKLFQQRINNSYLLVCIKELKEREDAQ